MEENKKETAQEVPVQEQPQILNLIGEARECALLGNEIVKQLFKDISLDETINRLDEVINVLKIIESKNKYNITEAIGIIPYAQSYAVNVKDWGIQKETVSEVPTQNLLAGKKTVGIKNTHQLEKSYETKLENGTLLKTTINLGIENFTFKDFKELLSRFAINSHNFYLYAAQGINNTKGDEKMEVNKKELDEEMVSINELLNGKYKNLLRDAISHDLNLRYEIITLDYAKFIQKSIMSLEKGESIDCEAISRFGEAVRLISGFKREKREEKVGTSDISNEKYKYLLGDENLRDFNTSFQCFIINYVKYLRKSIDFAQKGQSVDEEVINTYANALRVFLIMKRDFSIENSASVL